MMQIDEEQKGSQEDDDKSQDSLFFKDLAKGNTEKLNMADLIEQHRQLTEKIAASQKKVLEEGLRRNRNSSQLVGETHKRSASNLDITKEPSEARLTQQQPKTGPNMDYFKHIQ